MPGESSNMNRGFGNCRGNGQKKGRGYGNGTGAKGCGAGNGLGRGPCGSGMRNGFGGAYKVDPKNSSINPADAERLKKILEEN